MRGGDGVSALIVGNPTGDLPFAGAEARAVHRVFCPGGTYVGLPAGEAAAAGWAAFVHSGA